MKNNTLKKISSLYKKIDKKSIILVGMLIYIISKLYVNFTPDPSDDEYPDQVRNVISDIFTAND